MKNLFSFLKKNFPFTFPKIPTKEVFLNPAFEGNLRIFDSAYKLIENGNYKNLGKVKIKISTINPTQKFLFAANLLKIKNINTDTNAFLVKYKKRYYIIDGHHRIALNILNGNSEVFAYVYLI